MRLTFEKAIEYLCDTHEIDPVTCEGPMPDNPRDEDQTPTQ